MEEKLEMNEKILKSCNQGMALGYDKLIIKMEDESKNTNVENNLVFVTQSNDSHHLFFFYFSNKIKNVYI